MNNATTEQLDRPTRATVRATITYFKTAGNWVANGSPEKVNAEWAASMGKLLSPCGANVNLLNQDTITTVRQALVTALDHEMVAAGSIVEGRRLARAWGWTPETAPTTTQNALEASLVKEMGPKIWVVRRNGLPEGEPLDFELEFRSLAKGSQVTVWREGEQIDTINLREPLRRRLDLERVAEGYTVEYRMIQRGEEVVDIPVDETTAAEIREMARKLELSGVESNWEGRSKGRVKESARTLGRERMSATTDRDRYIQWWSLFVVWAGIGSGNDLELRIGQIPDGVYRKAAHLRSQDISPLSAVEELGMEPVRGEREDVKIVPVPASVAPPPAPEAEEAVNGRRVYGKSYASTCRALGAAGFTYDQARRVFLAHGINPIEDSLKKNLWRGKTGKAGAPAEFTPDQWTEMRKVAQIQ